MTTTTDGVVVTGGAAAANTDGHNGERRDGERTPTSEVQVGENACGTHDVATTSTNAL